MQCFSSPIFLNIFQSFSLEHLETVELTYHVGSIHSPGPSTHHFLEVRGGQLTSLALICNTMSMTMLTVIAQTCPGLAQLWLRSNHLAAPPVPEQTARYLAIMSWILSSCWSPFQAQPHLPRQPEDPVPESRRGRVVNRPPPRLLAPLSSQEQQ